MSQDVEVILPDPPETVESLRARLEEKERELAEREEQLKAYRGLRTWAAKIFLGSDLTQASRDFFNTTEPTKPLPREETAELFAAVVHRVFYVGVVGVLLAVIPGAVSSGLLWKQNQLVGFQNEAIREQNEKIQVQLTKQSQAVAKQESDTQMVRRTQLLTLIYEEEDCDLEALRKEVEDEEEKKWIRCPPKAPLRLRQEAVLALAKIDKKELDLSEATLEEVNLSEVTLSRAKLEGANLPEATLSRAKLEGANLSRANLFEANLSEANLSVANLSVADLSGATLSGATLFGAYLGGANLSGAYLGGAHLEGAHLSRATLSRAYLGGANLSRANLSTSFDLTQRQLEDTYGDAETQIPAELKRPEHWRRDGEEYYAWVERLEGMGRNRR